MLNFMNVKFDDGHNDQKAKMLDLMVKDKLMRQIAAKLLNELVNNGFTGIAVQYLNELKQSLNKKG